MEIAIGIFAGIALITLALIPHEAAHAVACINRGVEIKEAGLGLPWGKRLYFNVPWLSFPLTITAVPLGAYVDTTEDGEKTMKALPASEKAVIYGAGVLANIVIALLAFAIYQLVMSDVISVKLILVALVSWFVAALMWRFRKWVAFVAMPLVGLAILGYLIHSFWPAFSQDFVYAATHGGANVEGGGNKLLSIIGIVALISQHTAIPALILWYILISAILGITNVLPMKWLDGGAIFTNLYKRVTGREFPKPVLTASGILLIFLSLIAVWSDITTFLI